MSSLDFELDGEPATELLERRWFAALAATRNLQAECDLLFEALSLADAAWRRAREQLAEFEALRDTLEQRLTAGKGPSVPQRAAPPGAQRSAA
jgi:hypothetical protein